MEEITMANQTNAQKRNTNDFLSVLISAVIVGLAWGSFTSKGCSSGPSSSHVEKNKQYHMTSGAVGFTSKDSLEKYYQYYQQNDNSARMSYLTAHMASGDAVMFSGGETVTVTEMYSWSGMAKVRRSGNYSEYWVFTDCLE